MKTFDYSTYLSPFTWRYGSDKMRTIWSEVTKRKLWRKMWVTLAKAQYRKGLVTKKELDDLIKHQHDIDIDASHKIEQEIHHDLMAEIKVFAKQAKAGGGKIHLGATSMDIEDNVDTIRIKESFVIIEQQLVELLKIFSQKIDQYKNTVCMGYTHLQPAEPTTLGYRFSFYAQDLLLDLRLLRFVSEELKGKGIKGAVGTAASYVELLNEKSAKDLEDDVMEKIGIQSVDVSNQTGPRKLDFFVSQVLSSIAQSLYKFAFDLRIMQSPGFGEWHEPFAKKQIGSSAMPFKKNPIKSEQICSLARLIFHLSDISRDNASHMLLERTLDDSANRRIYIPEIFLAIDTILTSTTRITQDMEINTQQVKKNLEKYGPFAATEKIMMKATKNGGDRQELHALLRELSLISWQEIQKDQKNPLQQLVEKDKRIMKFISDKNISNFFKPENHIGLAPQKCQEFLRVIKNELR